VPGAAKLAFLRNNDDVLKFLLTKVVVVCVARANGVDVTQAGTARVVGEMRRRADAGGPPSLGRVGEAGSRLSVRAGPASTALEYLQPVRLS